MDGSAGLRVRAFGRGSSTVVSPNGLASVMVAAALGMAVAVGAPASADEAIGPSGPGVELISHQVVPAVVPAQATHHEPPVETPPALPAELLAAPAGGDAASVSVEHGEEGTVIEAHSTVPNSKARVTVGDDGERFVVTHEVEVATGTDLGPVGAYGDTVSASCGGTIGSLLCDSDDGSSQD